MNWIYKGKIVNEEFAPPEGSVGFVYMIYKYKDSYERGLADKNWPLTEPDKIYIGKKFLIQTNKKRIGVREIKATKTRKRVRRVTKSSNWMEYESSCKPLQQEIKEHPEQFRKEIIRFCYSKKELSYREVQEMFRYNILEIDSFNDNIGGKYFRKDIIKPTKTEI